MSQSDQGDPARIAGEPGIGSIAGGVAHEINDPLSVIRANLSYVIERLSDLSFEDRARLDGLIVALEDASRAATRMTQVVRELAAVGQVSDVPPGPVDLVASLDAALATIGHELEVRARVIRKLDRVPDVVGREPLLCRALVQVLASVVRGMSEAQGNDREIELRTSVEGAYVVLEISTAASGHEGRHPLLAAALIEALGGRLDVRTERERMVRRVILIASEEEASYVRSRPVTPVGGIAGSEGASGSGAGAAGAGSGTAGAATGAGSPVPPSGGRPSRGT
jgi:hypothetical protein